MSGSGVVIVGRGFVTAAGSSGDVSTGAFLSGVSRITAVEGYEGDDDDDEGATACIARVGPLVEEGRLRAWALIDRAVRDALGQISLARPPSSAALFFTGADAEESAAWLAARLSKWLRVPVTSQVAAPDGASSLVALDRARAAVLTGMAELAIVAAADLRTAPASLEVARRAGRLAGPGRAGGHVPGDAAAALVLAGEAAARALGAFPLARVLGIGVASEVNPLGSARPNTGTGLTAAIERALAGGAPDLRATDLLADLNGERHRTDEWGFAMTRLSARLPDAAEVVWPATSWGDCGAANGLVLAGLAITRTQRGFASGSHALVCCSSDGAARAALLLDIAVGGSARPQARLDAGAQVAWADLLDDDVLAEVVDEAAFAYIRRSGVHRPTDWTALELAERALDRLCDALASAGAAGQRCVRLLLEDAPDSAAVYVGMRALLESNDLDAAVAFAEQWAPTVALQSATGEAFQHARITEDHRAALAHRLFQHAALTMLALDLAAAGCLAIEPATLETLALGLGTPELAQRFARAVGRLRAPDAPRLLRALWAAPEPDVRREVAIAELLVRGGAIRSFVLAAASKDPALLIPAALVVEGSEREALAGLALSVADRPAHLAAALCGFPATVPRLLERIDDDPDAVSTALEILLGEAPVEEIEVPDEDPLAPPNRVRRVARSRAAWVSIMDRVLGGHPAGAPLRAGQPMDARATLRLLERPHLPREARECLALELVLRWRVAPRPLDVSAPVAVQAAWLARADARL